MRGIALPPCSLGRSYKSGEAGWCRHARSGWKRRWMDNRGGGGGEEEVGMRWWS